MCFFMGTPCISTTKHGVFNYFYFYYQRSLTSVEYRIHAFNVQTKIVSTMSMYLSS